MEKDNNYMYWTCQYFFEILKSKLRTSSVEKIVNIEIIIDLYEKYYPFNLN